jgi:uncharacterized protein (DUF885 family)
MRQVSAQIGFPNAPHEAMKAMEKDHPTADQLIAETRGQLESVRKYLIDHDIVTVPSEERCAVTETPSFMRWATAAMDFPGPYETKATNAFYYVTPVEPDWSAEKAEQWLSIFNYSTLRSVNVHEAYPGHFLHYLHTRSAPSKISVVFGAYSFWEGWAHYVEEMMVEQGFGEDDRFVSMGQIAEALLRTSRFLCSIRMHTEGMSVEEATQFIEKNAYMEKLPAHKEALRGTFDPMYLNYTLGKLMILKLREDYRAEKGEGFSLREFHDALLALGAPPLPLAREMLIRDQAQPVL